MNRATLTLTCPHCFQKLELPDRSFVGKRSGCPQCEGIVYLAADSTRGVVGLLPGKHSANALLVHGILNRLKVAAPPAPAPAKRSTPAPAKKEAVSNTEPAAIPPGLSLPPAPVAPAPSPPALPLPAPPPPGRTSGPRQTQHASTSKSFAPPVSPARSRGGLAIIGSSVAAVVALLLIILFWPRRESPETRQEVASLTRPDFDGDAVNESLTRPTRKPAPNSADLAQGRALPMPEEPADSRSQNSTFVALAEIPPIESELPAINVDPEPAPVLADAAEAALAEIPDASSALKPIDVAHRLEQPIKRFEQVQGVPAVEILNLLEEMLGVPVLFDREELGPAGEGLDRSISLRLQSTTVGGILDATLEKAGLGWTIDGESIRIRRRGERGASAP